MTKRLRRAVRGRRVHRWPVSSTAATARPHEPGTWTRAVPDERLPLPFPGRPAETSPSADPDNAGGLDRPSADRGVARLQLISPVPAPRPTAPPEAEEVHAEFDNRRADAEALLGLLLVVLIFLGIARADDLRRMTDHAVLAIDQRITALEDVRIALRMAYAELRWRVGERP